MYILQQQQKTASQLYLFSREGYYDLKKTTSRHVFLTTHSTHTGEADAMLWSDGIKTKAKKTQVLSQDKDRRSSASLSPLSKSYSTTTRAVWQAFIYLSKQNVLQGKWHSKSTVQIDLIHNTSHLCARSRIDVTWFLRGQTSEIICQFKKSRSSCLF